ncbi:alpha-(1,3)-fucosyltransferase 4-like [Nerophis ophidion]|uniref:alpha-(1,3)-fucosyltransferase 4-like n=1 Tax=Nerophis ophidion TaxID=159077 RepID=UPI002AE0AE94|nr:alpha-(1,3)-fucosyltransferase 4-like [Nerophis ophidion]
MGLRARSRRRSIWSKSDVFVRLSYLLAFLLLLGVCLRHLPEPLPLTNRAVSGSEREVTILIWTHPFGRYRRPPDCAALYDTDGCVVTDDRRAYSRADAVVVHHRDVAAGRAELPPRPRPAGQKWVWLNYESPTHTPALWRMEGFFNLTLTYRADSDIFLPYGYLVPGGGHLVPGGGHLVPGGGHLVPGEGHLVPGGGDLVPGGGDLVPGEGHLFPGGGHLVPGEGHLVPGGGHLVPGGVQQQVLQEPSRSSRPRLVAWVVSNWVESHARVLFYRQLRHYVQVDVFGRAGRDLPEGSGRVVALLRRYTFYLSLENSQHTDYITEKLWNAVLAGAVPVVLGPGRKNYERFLPPEAFIHVDDFPTVRELASYLLALWRDPARLMRHLRWRRDLGVYQPAFWAEHYCAACRVVRRTLGRTNVVQDLAVWFES